MNALSKIRSRFLPVVGQLVDDPIELLSMIRPAGDPKFGDYQANCAMPLGKRLGRSPRDIAAELVQEVKLDDFCQSVEIAGPGFINLKLDDAWLKEALRIALVSDRLGIEPVELPKTFVVDYSSPNVAKPMHVGHIRSTVIGDAITNVLKFVGHDVISDNHLGDWGTQFGMIIYGYKHFLDQDAYTEDTVAELGRLYKFVRKLMDYHSAVTELPQSRVMLEDLNRELSDLESQTPTGDKKVDKQSRKQIGSLKNKIDDIEKKVETSNALIQEIEGSPDLRKIADQHSGINTAVLTETVALHESDPTNKGLWEEFLPFCREDIQKIYSRLGIVFDHELGESFYHDELANVVADLKANGLTRESDGAICVFLDNHDAPMIVQKRDGAFLYSTTDLATIKHRVDTFRADACLYVVDHRQSDHFDKLFDVAKLWGYDDVSLVHVRFGTVLGDDGTPFKTRAGDTVGLESLLDEAESRAMAVVQEQDSGLSTERLAEVARVVGLGGLKYADLSQNRGSDYKFSYDKMLSLRGNTATYLQYGYARVQGILRKTGADIDAIRANPSRFEFENEIERELAVKIVRFSEALDEVLVEYKPNILCNYLFELSQLFAQFFDQCSVKDASSESLKVSRLQLCVLTARTIKTGLGLLGIGVLDKM